MSSRCSPDSRNFLWWRRNPLVRLPRRDPLYVHGINLLQSPTLTFDDKEVDEKPAKDVTTSENISVTKVNRAGDERSKECYRTELALSTYPRT